MPYIGTDINYGDIAKQVVTSTGSTTPTALPDLDKEYSWDEDTTSWKENE